MRHIPHLLVPGPWEGAELPLAGDQCHHLERVLKLAGGALVTYTDGVGRFGSGRLDAGHVARGEEADRARATEIVLAVAPPSARDRARFLVEKAAELGVMRLVWIRTSLTQGRSPSLAKARSWAASALEQSRGSWLMEITDGEIADLDPDDLVVADPGGEDSVPDRRTLLVGPEGGLAPGEIPGSAILMTLGPSVLRVETAVVAGVVLLSARHRRSRDN